MSRRGAVLLVHALALLCCDGSPLGAACAAGTEVACRCTDGAPGVATCNADGTSFEACSCDGATGGGNLGTGGGNGGTSHSVGGGGAGGTAGMGGAGGAAVASSSSTGAGGEAVASSSSTGAGGEAVAASSSSVGGAAASSSSASVGGAGGGSSSSTGGGPCGSDLSNIGVADFRISVEVTTLQSGSVAVANQRASCTNGTFWDLRLSNGQVQFEVDGGGSPDDEVVTGTVVNDGITHLIVAKRVSSLLSIEIDGGLSGTTTSLSSLGPLTTLQVGGDVCEGTDGTMPFIGTIGNVCVDGP